MSLVDPFCAVTHFVAELDRWLRARGASGLDAEHLEAAPGTSGAEVPASVQAWFAETSVRALATLPALAGVVAALADLVPSLDWYKRPSDGSDAVFDDGHFNAIVVGDAGLASMGQVLIGVSLMARGVSYPVHRHPPDECYLVLSPGEWWREDDGWWTPGIGNLVYNAGNQLHAMRAGAESHLSVWVLQGQGAAGFSPGS
ncbi:dimethylsulfonioproprionate lyase family protein [Pseudomonas putida]|uniref:dimethylsulfonioproprionate lyase family protein n=1 Tax=Pseudomonas putida TaxID=303 RepID=UPI001404A92D|nr:dimethylsulfonioproprionate lyase family protein [Pseudomonas putida]